mmetsp:Transcript_1583/g.4750  ORF Transcript_1583/g.4750 Transcript_1583/m.4750 type:complete len:262 (+) Transcript_1583:123-908(+)
MRSFAFAMPLNGGLSRVRIVLVEPEGPINVGSVARVLTNFGLERLTLVSPRVSLQDPTCAMFASHAGDVLAKASTVNSMEEALQGARFIAATTARARDAKSSRKVTFSTPRQCADKVLSLSQETAIIFGPEWRGLSNEELGMANELVRIPSNPAYPVLNLSHSVGVVCYELFLAATEPESVASDEPLLLAEASEKEGLFRQLEDVLDAAGYFRTEDAREDKMANFRCMINRLAPISSDVSMIRGVLRRIRNSLSHRSSPCS